MFKIRAIYIVSEVTLNLGQREMTFHINKNEKLVT